MEFVIILGALALVIVSCSLYRAGKREGSRKGFGVGRSRARQRK